MTNFISFARRLALAAALVLGVSPAFAVPIYHVAINTAGISAPSGLLDFSFYSTTDAQVTTVQLSNLTGAFGPTAEFSGDVVKTAAGYSMSTAIDAQSFLTFGVPFGGNFGFDVAFADDYSGIDTAILSIGLYSPGFTEYFGSVVKFERIPATSQAASFVSVTQGEPFASTSAIPEPSELLLMLTALAMAGFITGRARENVR